jgi:hypothetical protein
LQLFQQQVLPDAFRTGGDLFDRHKYSVLHLMFQYSKAPKVART